MGNVRAKEKSPCGDAARGFLAIKKINWRIRSKISLSLNARHLPNNR